MKAAAQMCYVIFREAYARDTGIPLKEFDEQAARALVLMVTSLANPPPEQEPEPME
ncbi:hypothetical protein [Streptomyces celluloflavus]|uniref:Uncharacterized protein n=1 Tax=Streptomyces celluloflavus TaxID=58344 RepID=A0ABW7RNH5_9ACTN